ncbi:MAG: tRNA lysidine(34) synthetase TilS [Methylococcales symbiont of Hymedesmia sp. n. MRB-2018]|nr:MAG: tRNA lysidine(34) synthetase TilS [Methylococcales symbiont of Hymedesmia sp. n. MRB-2018]
MLTFQTIVSTLPADTEKIYIGFSGGKDSHVLLHILASKIEIKSKVCAVYIHHGLHVEADEWQKHCQVIALENGVSYQSIKVNAEKQNRQSQEEIARDARYQAFKSLLTKNDVLLLAQHRQDQMETVLLQLFRGSGVQGLAAMPLSTNFGKGKMIRPLLDVSQTAIDEYAKQHKLQWIEDPSNQNDEFDRNFLRNQILPQLKKRWPALDKTVSRSARHCADSYHLNDDLSKQLLNSLYNANEKSLNITQLLELNDNKQHYVIRQWFTVNQLRMPSEKVLIRIIREVLKAKPSANPEIRTKTYCIRRYRDKLFCFKNDMAALSEDDKCWKKGANKLRLNASILSLSEASEGISKTQWNESEVTVKFRKGSEKIKLAGREGRHTLKKLLQEKEIPPWERALVPLIYLNDSLAAIADLWVSEDFIACSTKQCVLIQWTGLVNNKH